MSKAHETNRRREQSLAKLSFHLSRMSGNSPSTTFEMYSLACQRKRMLIPDAHHDPLIKHPLGYEPSDTSLIIAIDDLAENFPGHPPPSSKIIFLAHKTIPRKIPERFGKVASSLYSRAISMSCDKY